MIIPDKSQHESQIPHSIIMHFCYLLDTQRLHKAAAQAETAQCLMRRFCIEPDMRVFQFFFMIASLRHGSISQGTIIHLNCLPDGQQMHKAAARMETAQMPYALHCS
eukprot:gnl/MRDRNA2_/MRDRNA2_83925_c0_seq4.p1 gnl/MRDRNA2_/MRDRNA2_83925_c0~~gnl/MRDRNA2_/MRDRNA2_83925_c0_seq4.p1  ORF type:complete len:107 (-),score=10.10 gnl/MRDRNA2_/MRDRNA2_83925_c0_seq4:108-428(-)